MRLNPPFLRIRPVSSCTPMTMTRGATTATRRGGSSSVGRIDGTVVFRIRGDRVFAEITSGRPVEVDRFSFSQPLPAATLGHVELEEKDGRGKIVVLERPWEGNGFTAVLQVSDPKRSDDRYHFRLKWKR